MSTEVGDVRVYDDRLWSEIEREISVPALFGTVVLRGDESDYGARLSTLLHTRCGPSKILDISCSSYSRAIDFGALLFLLRGPEIVDTSSEVSVFLAIKRKLREMYQEPPVVVIDHASFLDIRSAQILVHLASAGLLRLLLIVEILEDLPQAVHGLLHNRQLSVMSSVILTRAQFNQYLLKRLGQEFGPAVASHYWTVSRGDLQILEMQLRADLRRGLLVNEGSLWTLCPDGSHTEAGRVASGSTQVLTSISERLEMITQPTGQERSAERATAHKSLQTRGFRRATMAIVSPRISQHCEERKEQYFRVQEAGYLLHENSLAAAQLRLDTLKSVGGCPQSAQSHYELRAREIWAAHEAVGDLDSAYQSMNAIEQSRIGADSAVHLQSAVLGRYLDIRRGVPVNHAGYRELSQEDVNGLLDAPWSDESLRLLGMLCMAHTLSESGRISEAKRLLSWSVNQFEVLNQHKFSLRHRWLVAPITYVALDLATRLKEDDVAAAFNSHVRNLPVVDEAAEHYATYFTLVQALGARQQRDDSYLQAMIQVLQDGPMTKAAEPLIRCAEATIALRHGQSWAGVELHQLTQPATANHASLQVAKLSCWSLMRFSETMPHFLPLRELSQDALALGDQLTGIELGLAATVVGEEFSAGLLPLIAGEEFSETRTALVSLSLAMKAEDKGQELAARIILAELGFCFQLETWSSRQAGLAAIDRCRVNHALLKPVASSELDRVQGETEPSSELFVWSTALTKRERTIATLAAAGRRNQEIATDCRISVRTVEGHVYQILTKLGLSSRRELAILVDSSMGQGAVK